jgi:hypothetical protein
MALASSTALAHGPHGNYPGPAGQGQGPMMGQGYGPMMGQGCGGMMGRGHGPMMGQHHGRMMGHGNMMGYGHMDHGRMGQGWGPMMGQGRMMGQGAYAPLAEDLSVDGVRHIMEHRVAMRQNPNLKVGEITEVDDDTITADVVTQEGSLVRRFMIDRHTGAMRPADMEE